MDEELKAIVQRMVDAKESEENIATVIQGWKPKKSNEVSTQGSKNTSKTSTEPSLISQSNPFGNTARTAPTINVATGKVGTEKVSSGSTKASKSLYADALLAVQSPIQTTSDLLSKGLGKVADGIFGEPRKTLRDRILEADTPNTTNKVGKAQQNKVPKEVKRARPDRLESIIFFIIYRSIFTTL